MGIEHAKSWNSLKRRITMNYLVSGAASPLGTVLCKKLTDINCAVTAVVRDGNAFSKENKFSKKIDIVECDLSDPHAVDELCASVEKADKKIWSFVHLAATSPGTVRYVANVEQFCCECLLDGALQIPVST